MSLSALLLLIVGVVSAAYAANARWPRRNASLWVMIVSWFMAFIVVELAVHLTVLGAVMIAVLAGAFGALDDGSTGWVGLAFWGVAVVLAIPLGVSSLRTRLDIDGRSEELELDDAPGLPWYWYAVPLLMWVKPGVKTERGRVFAEVDGEKLKLDIVRPKHDPGHPLPAVVHVHGGLWMFGSRHEQGIPLLNHLASNGWVGFNIDYRLSPKATMPDHVEDVKRAIAWVREHAEELNVDPKFIAVTGGSAGGHLTALTALSNGDPAFQRGFEDADTSVQAAVPFYGAYDFVDHENKHSETLVKTVEKVVVKQTMDEAPEFYATISPTHRINEDAPPFFVVHGSRDTIVPVGESRRFVKNLRTTSQEAVLYAEMPGGQHAFDSMPTWRSGPVIKAIERFLHATYATRYLGGEATEDVAEKALTN
ncbi:MAG: alpha/beta hydrolase [Solirubrobacteraceae bacterium]|nr:alpha/beta hydrolase [Solirubrobacteraceae bacterium]